MVGSIAVMIEKSRVPNASTSRVPRSYSAVAVAEGQALVTTKTRSSFHDFVLINTMRSMVPSPAPRKAQTKQLVPPRLLLSRAFRVRFLSL